MILVIFLQVDVSIMLSIIEQIISSLQSVIHFMNGAGMCWIIRSTVFNMYICLNHGQSYKYNQIERRD